MFMGGNYLPDTEDGEVEIARIAIASTTFDVTCLFARAENGLLHYRVVDEYDGDTLTGPSEMTSDKSLSLGEMADFFLAAWSLNDVLQMNFEGDVNSALGFFQAKSQFYSDFDRLCRQRVIEAFPDPEEPSAWPQRTGPTMAAARVRHASGYALANRGHDTRALQAYLGHKNIQHTVRYTELSPTRFKNFWREWALSGTRQAQWVPTCLGQDRAVISGLSSRKLFGSHTGAPNGGIFYFLTLDNNILANRLNSYFVNQTSAAHHPEIGRWVILTIGHLGTG
jgi:hypothetical protein